MANLFLNIPVPAANGAGAPVDVSAMGKTKSFVCGGGFVATVNVEYANDLAGVGPWAQLATFQQSGNLTIDVAARWLRANVSNYKGGAPNLDVGSNDAGSVFALLPAAGTSVDISALPLLKTAVAPSGFAGNVEISEDGVSWAQIFAFQNGGGVTRPVVGQFARAIGGADVWIGGANDDAAGAAGPQIADARVRENGVAYATRGCSTSRTSEGLYHVDFLPVFPSDVAVVASIHGDPGETVFCIYPFNVTPTGFDVAIRGNTDGFLLEDAEWSFVAVESLADV